jgi:hypothetical protein|tara:strand:+ start:1474 stop:1908 length:435 start_codon:yes stop_codon:yes gene_type:complete
MTQLIFDRDEELAEWAEAQYPPCAPLPRPFTTIGVASSEGGHIWAVAIYTDFSQYNVELTLISATRRWATPGNFRAILHYPFEQLGVKRMTAVTNKSNKPARKALEGVGFKLEGVHPFADGGVRPKVSYGLSSVDAKDKWLNYG